MLSAVSTALWTGVYLADILNDVQPQRSRGAKHVIFEGGDSLSAPGYKGPYGTSQRLSRAMNCDNEMLIGMCSHFRLSE